MWIITSVNYKEGDKWLILDESSLQLPNIPITKCQSDVKSIKLFFSFHAKTKQTEKNRRHLKQTALWEMTTFLNERRQFNVNKRRVLLHQCPLWIPKWTIYHDVR